MTRILLYGDSIRNPNIYYRTGFLAPDPVIYVESEGVGTLAVSLLERGRAEKESRVKDIRCFDDLGYDRVLQETGDVIQAQCAVILALANGAGREFDVEPDFPVLLADRLRASGLNITPKPDLIAARRRVKSAEEIEALARAQARAEQAVSEARAILAEADIRDDSLLYRGMPLTAERLRGELNAAFARDNYGCEAMIVAPGTGSSDPHWFGSGPIRPHQPIILDIFPQDRATRYHGDVTRTYVKGTPGAEISLMFDTVKVAQQLALDMIKPGANGRDIHRAVTHHFAGAGFGEDGPHAARYIHGTGHGLGLEVHEAPRISRVDEELRAGDVITVEPGLYDPSLGGVRIEDVVVVTEEGHRNLNRLPKELVIS